MDENSGRKGLTTKAGLAVRPRICLPSTAAWWWVCLYCVLGWGKCGQVRGFSRLGSVLTSSPLDQHRGLSQECGIMKVKILQWHAVASWTWDAHDDACGICRMAFDGCCPDCKMPGDDCPLMWGACNHAFHLHCILKWVNSQSPRPQCPMCRRDWKFRGD